VIFVVVVLISQRLTANRKAPAQVDKFCGCVRDSPHAAAAAKFC
jgi:hypothetical protein